MPSTNENFEINNVWGQDPDEKVEQLTLPSGQTCLAKRPGLESLMFSGHLLDLDTLTATVDKKHIRRVRGGNGVSDGVDIDPASILKDPDALRKIIRLADSLLPQIVVEPKVAIHYTTDDEDVDHPIPKESRKPGLIYTDQIHYEDKMFLMQFGIGGTRDAEQFREQSGQAVASVVPIEGVQGAPERTRPRKKSKRR